MAAESTGTTENLVHKIIAGIFAAVVAPVMVAFGVKFSDKVFTPATPPAASSPATPASTPADASAAAPVAATTPSTTAAPATPAAAAHPPLLPNPAALAAPSLPPLPAGPPAGRSGASGLATAGGTPLAAAADAAPHVPLPSFKKPLSQAQRLFNGRDLTGFYTYLGRPAPKSKPYGKNYDPDQVFSVQDGMLRVSGEVPGAIETVKTYSNYWLTVEYKWSAASAANSDLAHHSAVLLNIQGDDGVVRGAFPCSFHAQIIEGSTGDLFIANGSGQQQYSLTAAVEERPFGKGTMPFYTPGAPKTTFAQGAIKRYVPGGQGAKGIHSTDNLERPVGEWNTLECVSLNGKIFVRLNDHVVNFAIDASPDSGRIGIQSHGAEIFFREITLQPYTKHHDHGDQASAQTPAN